MTQEMIDNALAGIDYKRSMIVAKMKEINKRFDGKAIYYDKEYNELRNELYKLDYQAGEIKDMVAE